MATDLKKAHRQLLEEAFGDGRLGAFDAVCDPGFRPCDPLAGKAKLNEWKENCALYRSAFPGLRCTFLGQVGDGDIVATHWRMSGIHKGPLMGIPPTGASCTWRASRSAGSAVASWSRNGCSGMRSG
ncbi:MAG TPA: ester cyclase [Anaeromyxobacter sp.]|nr:ester cyclase [Anaeromyxobacter sp.]